jgi:hypothetical protein
VAQLHAVSVIELHLEKAVWNVEGCSKTSAGGCTW